MRAPRLRAHNTWPIPALLGVAALASANAPAARIGVWRLLS
jgi:hypothetical protein